MVSESQAFGQEANLKSSWGDPKFKIAVKNLPVNSFKTNETPMTGIEFGFSQKIPLTTKYSVIKESLHSLKKAKGI